MVNTFDKVAIGYTLVPEINYGFGASVKWKGIDVSVFFSGVGHVTRIIQGQNLFGASSTILRMGQIFEDVAKNRWTLDNQNPNAPYPRLSLNKVDCPRSGSISRERTWLHSAISNSGIPR